MIYALYPEFGYEMHVSDHNLAVFNKLYDLIRENIEETVSIVHSNRKYSLKDIYYHKKFGWTLVSSIGKAFLGKLQKTKHSKIEIGLMSYISGSSNIYGTGKVKIGSFTSIADGVELLSSNYSHPTHLLSTYNFTGNIRIIEEGAQFNTQFEEQPDVPFVNIGSDVWIAKNVLIMNGVSIENGAVIATKSIVNKNVECYSICGGVPIKKIKYRFEKKERDRYKILKWWDWDLKKIIDNKNLFL